MGICLRGNTTQLKHTLISHPSTGSRYTLRRGSRFISINTLTTFHVDAHPTRTEGNYIILREMSITRKLAFDLTNVNLITTNLITTTMPISVTEFLSTLRIPATKKGVEDTTMAFRHHARHTQKAIFIWNQPFPMASIPSSRSHSSRLHRSCSLEDSLDCGGARGQTSLSAHL